MALVVFIERRVKSGRSSLSWTVVQRAASIGLSTRRADFVEKVFNPKFGAKSWNAVLANRLLANIVCHITILREDVPQN